MVLTTYNFINSFNTATYVFLPYRLYLICIEFVSFSILSVCFLDFFFNILFKKNPVYFMLWPHKNYSKNASIMKTTETRPNYRVVQHL